MDRAAARGLVARRRGAHRDGRVTVVELTPDGRRHVERFIAVLQEAIDPLFDEWPEDSRAQAAEVLGDLAQALEQAGYEPHDRGYVG